MATILTVIGAGIAGSALTYALTWLRRSRRHQRPNRAPQRAAIADIVEATYELTLRVFAFRDACEERARQSEGKTFRRVSDAELEELTNQAQRALFGAGRAFHIGRMTVNADCYEAMAAAFNNFTKLQGTLEGVAEMAPTAPNMREKMASIVFTGGLNRGTVMLVKAGRSGFLRCRRGGISGDARKSASGLKRSISCRVRKLRAGSRRRCRGRRQACV